MQRIEAVFFDMDGVLVDSKEANFAWIASIVEEYGYQRPRKEDYVPAFGMDRHDTIKLLAKEQSEEKIRELMALANLRNDAFPLGVLKVPRGEKRVLERLSKSYKLGIITNGQPQAIERLFAVADIKNYFSVIITRNDFTKPKPDPEPLLIASKRLGINPKRAIYVGDLDVDVGAGHAAGMKVIGFSENGVDGADANASSFGELPVLLNRFE